MKAGTAIVILVVLGVVGVGAYFLVKRSQRNSVSDYRPEQQGPKPPAMVRAQDGSLAVTGPGGPTKGESVAFLAAYGVCKSQGGKDEACMIVAQYGSKALGPALSAAGSGIKTGAKAVADVGAKVWDKVTFWN